MVPFPADRRSFRRATIAGVIAASCSLVSITACTGADGKSGDSAPPVATDSTVAAGALADSAPATAVVAGNDAAGSGAPAIADTSARTPNEMGRIPVLEYHLIVPKEEGEFTRTPAQLQRDLEELHRRGYVPVNMVDVLDKTIQNLPRGKSPVVLVFDDASPSQFRYIEQNGTLTIDPTSAVGILERFADRNPGWPRKAVFCMLPAAQAGRSFFGDKGIEGQKTEWRYRKVQFLHKQGYELCNHTLYHARLDRAGSQVQEFIARGDMAIDSAVPGYKVRTFALPLGMWPKERSLAWQGAWTDPKSKRVVRYQYDAVLEVSGNPNESINDPAFNARSVNRQIMYKNALDVTLRNLDRPGPGGRYVSDGDPKTIAKP